MTSVLDKPTVDTTTLNDTWLNETVECRLGDAEAAWLWAMKCCDAETKLCNEHDAHAYTNSNRMLLEANRYWVCDYCGHNFGYTPRFSEVCDRRPI